MKVAEDNCEPIDDADVPRPASDIWMLGVMLFELLSGGKIPYLYEPCTLEEFVSEDNNKFEMLRDSIIVEGNDVKIVDHCSRVSPIAQDLLSKVLQRDEKKRLTADQMLKHNFFARLVRNESHPLHASIISSLQIVEGKTQIHTVLLNAMSMKLQRDHYQACAAAFRRVDVDNSGTISEKEFVDALKDIHGESGEDKVKQMFKAADVDCDESLSLNEFIAVTFDWHSLDHTNVDQNIERVIEDFDTDKDGQISLDELQRGLRGVVSNQTVAKVFEVIDVDDNKQLSKHELCNFLFRPMTEAQIEKMNKLSQRKKVVNTSCSCLVGVLPCL